MDTLPQIKEKASPGSVHEFLSKNIIRASLLENDWFYEFTPFGLQMKNFYLDHLVNDKFYNGEINQ